MRLKVRLSADFFLIISQNYQIDCTASMCLPLRLFSALWCRMLFGRDGWRRADQSWTLVDRFRPIGMKLMALFDESHGTPGFQFARESSLDSNAENPFNGPNT